MYLIQVRTSLPGGLNASGLFSRPLFILPLKGSNRND